MKKVHILLHKKVSTIYGCCETRQEAEQLKLKFPNPSVIIIRSVEVSNEMQYIP